MPTSLKPRKLVALDVSEFLLYSVTTELSRKVRSLTLQSARERESARCTFTEVRPDIVFHAPR